VEPVGGWVGGVDTGKFEDKGEERIVFENVPEGV